MSDIFTNIAFKLRPELKEAGDRGRISPIADVLGLLYASPFAIAGLIWLVAVTDLGVLRQNWAAFLLLAVLMSIFVRLKFFIIAELQAGGYADTEGSMEGIVLWSGILLFGPTVLWLDVIRVVTYALRNLQSVNTPDMRWNRARDSISELAKSLIPMLVALFVYERLGGMVPIPGISVPIIFAGMVAILVQFLLINLVTMGYILYVIWSMRKHLNIPAAPLFRFLLLAYVLPILANPFGILAAGLYVQNDVFVYVFFMIGLILVAFLTHRLSWVAESSRQQSRQLEQLEKMGQAILSAPPDASTLPEILDEYVSTMFSASAIAIWVEPDRLRWNQPQEWTPEMDKVWGWLRSQEETQVFIAGDRLPWQSDRRVQRNPLVVAPIHEYESGKPIGGVYIRLRPLSLPWNREMVNTILPAVISLCNQISSAQHQADVYTDSLALQRTVQELSLARRIQTSFLPEKLPEYSGWQVTAALEPARQIAGDFYDFLTLPDGRLGILIADVADKGLGPALYMALSRTLIRTFAFQGDSEPSSVLSAANQRILIDARANLFVTVFYGVLDPISGELIYSNAGHTPPYLLCRQNGGEVYTLKNTGMPLGIDEDSTWRQETALIAPGDVLLLYTDGITDAQNEDGDFIDRKVVLQVAQKNIDRPVDEIQSRILEEVHTYIGKAPRFDDITIVLLGRNNAK
jgi:serine phosphatase RsbU (regulator of sigma subunit)